MRVCRCLPSRDREGAGPDPNRASDLEQLADDRNSRTAGLIQLQNDPHFCSRLESHGLIERPAGIARVQDHGADLVRAAPDDGMFHQSPRQPIAPAFRPRVYVEDICPPSPQPHHVWRPIHQPEPEPGRDRAVVISILRHSEPRQILARLHLSPEPRPELLAHAIQRVGIAIAHLEKHRAAMRYHDFRVIQRAWSNRERYWHGQLLSVLMA
jgi:hypothetical protein